MESEIEGRREEARRQAAPIVEELELLFGADNHCSGLAMRASSNTGGSCIFYLEKSVGAKRNFWHPGSNRRALRMRFAPEIPTNDALSPITLNQ
jgi:hypothetical protein